MRDFEPASALRDPSVVAAIQSLPDSFAAAGFDEGTVAQTLGAGDMVDLLSNSGLYSYVSWVTDGRLENSAGAVLTDLFVRNAVATPEVYKDLVPRGLRRVLESVGIVNFTQEGASAVVSISPYSSMYLFSDQLFRTGLNGVTRSNRARLVMPPHASTFELLSQVEVRPSAGTLVDVGCGCGVLSLVLSSRYDCVVGFDMNPRAVAFSTLNAMVNAMGASYFEDDITAPTQPVYADHLIFNTPTGPRYSDRAQEVGLAESRVLLRAVLASLRTVMSPGGLAQIWFVAELPHETTTILELVREWLNPNDVTSMEVKALTSSPFRVPAVAISRGRVDTRCLLLEDPGDAEELAIYLRSCGIREVVSAVLSVTI